MSWPDYYSIQKYVLNEAELKIKGVLISRMLLTRVMNFLKPSDSPPFREVEIMRFSFDKESQERSYEEQIDEMIDQGAFQEFEDLIAEQKKKKDANES